MYPLYTLNPSRGKDIIAILGMDELSEEDKLTVARARKASTGLKKFRLRCLLGCC